MKKRTTALYNPVFKCKVLHKVFCGASQSEAKKTKIDIKMHISFLGSKAKNVTINFHFVVQIFSESNTATSYSSVLFQRDGRRKELLCIVSCSISVTILTYKPVFTLKSTGLEIFSPTPVLGPRMGSRTPVQLDAEGPLPAALGTCQGRAEKLL